MTYHCRVYVGPTCVERLACAFRAAGVAVTVEGTAHVHFVLDAPEGEYGPAREFLRRLAATHGHTFCLGLRDVHVVRVLEHATEASFSL